MKYIFENAKVTLKKERNPFLNKLNIKLNNPK